MTRDDWLLPTSKYIIMQRDVLLRSNGFSSAGSTQQKSPEFQKLFVGMKALECSQRESEEVRGR